MTLDKLDRVLQSIKALNGGTTRMPHGFVCVSPGLELAIEFNGQPCRAVHTYLLRKGFVHDPNTCFYIYRPWRKP